MHSRCDVPNNHRNGGYLFLGARIGERPLDSPTFLSNELYADEFFAGEPCGRRFVSIATENAGADLSTLPP